jgi:hypothetical protein
MFLIPDEYHKDESFESYLLRISQANDFESYGLFSGAIKDYLRKTDPDASGAFPLELSLANVFHAKQSSSFRIRAIHLVEECIGLPQWHLYNLAIKHTLAHFSGTYAAVVRRHIQIPRCFIRVDKIPICPKCLEESVYIRHNWHLIPYTICHKHECTLIEHCPNCGNPLNYQKSEVISNCECGQDLTQIQPEKATDEALIISKLIADENTSYSHVLAKSNPSLRNGALLFYWLRHHDRQIESVSSFDFTGAIQYFNHWPASLYAELDQDVAKASNTQIKDFNKTAFQDVFGPILQHARISQTPNADSNFVQAALVKYLIFFVSNNPKSKISNLGDLLLNISETATLLACSYEQVYRFYEEGYLQLSFSPVLHLKLSVGTPAFYLRQVIELLLATHSCETDELAAW